MELPDNFYDQLYIGLNYFCRHYREGKPIESDEYEDDNEIPFEYDRERIEDIKLTLN